MYSKIINPAKEGQNAYNNKGSSMRLGNYLEKELDLQETPDGKIFFNDKGEFTKNEMVSLLDSNVKGLRESDDKFYSLVVNPSQDELEHIGNDREKLKIFAELCMENYAQNFNLTNKKGEQKNITSSELVWFATIEQSRTFKGTDPEVKEGTKKQGDLKEGLQTHIHITVSARDASMQTTLNPLTSNKNRFSMISWAKLNKASFDKSFGFESPKQNYTNEKREVWNKVLGVERQLSRFEEKYGLPFEDTMKLRTIANDRAYSKDFREKLTTLGKELRKEGGKNGLTKTQWETMLATQKDDRTREGRLEKTLSKMKEEFNLSSQSEDAIRKIAATKELSSDFFEKLQELTTTWKEQAAIEKSEGLKAQVLEGTSPVQSEKNLSKEETELLLSSTLDDRTREGRLEKTLSKMKEEFNLSSQSEDAIRKIGATKELSSDFFEKLQELTTTWKEQSIIEKSEGLKAQVLEGTSPVQSEKNLSKEETELLLSSTLDDRTREGRLEKTLSKMKEEFNLSSQSEDAIRKIGATKELSSDFFEKLQELTTT